MFFESIAALSTTSVADVECKHALSKHWSDRPFPTIVAKHINSEFRGFKLDAQTSVAGKISGDNLACLSAGTCGSNKAIVELKQKQIRSKSAYMFYRDEVIQSVGRSGQKANPATKEFWFNLKRDFSSLTPEMRAYYDSLAQQSSEHVKRRRAEQKRGHTLVGPQSSGTSSSERALVKPTGVVYNPWIVPATAVESSLKLSDMCVAIENAWLSCGSSSENLLGDDIQSVSPISENMLEKSWRENLKHGVSWADSLKRFDKESQRFARPTLGDEFPKKVFYQGCCGTFCRHSHNMKLVCFFQRLLDTFLDVAKSFGHISTAAQSDILLQFTVVQGAEESIFYAWLVAPSATSGVQRGEQVFVLCTSAGCQDQTHGQEPSLRCCWLFFF
eukprot:Skav232332  [mRNA]  locus=scaffold1704:104156:105316:+ [translate_table: standard]